MSAKSDPINGNETLIMENQSNQGLISGESVVNDDDRVRVFGEGVVNENGSGNGEGLRVQMEGLDVEIDLDSGDLDRQMEVLGGGSDGVDVVDLGVNERNSSLKDEKLGGVGQKSDQCEDAMTVEVGVDVKPLVDLGVNESRGIAANVESVENLVGDGRVRFSRLVGDGNAVEGTGVQMLNESVPYGSELVDVNGSQDGLIEKQLNEVDLGVNEGTGNAVKDDRCKNAINVESAENLVGDAQGGCSHLATVMQEVLDVKNESVPDGRMVNNCLEQVDKKVNQDGFKEEQLVEVVCGVGFWPDALFPERRGDKNKMEEEGKFYVSDLVWGKVRGHPWWPGQIFEPSAATNRAMKHFKKNSYLIAYFGDQTFAWNEASSIKPFRMYFSQMEKQSNSESFSHAVDCALEEVSRRVEFGLTCPCLLEETQAKVKSQIVMNAGIRTESRLRVGGDDFSGVTSFHPAELVRLLKSVAAAPDSGIDRLSFVLAKAQLVAFNRWKGYYELPVIEEFSDLENDSDVEPQEWKKDASDVAGVASEDMSSKSSTKRPRRSGVDEHPGKKEKLTTTLMSGSSSGIPNDQKKSRGRPVGKRNSTSSEKSRGRPVGKRNSTSSEKRRLAVDSMLSDSEAKRRKKVLPPSSGNKMSSPPEKFSAIGKRSEKSRNAGFGDSVLRPVQPEGEQLVPKVFPPPSEMLSKLYLAARDPMNGYSILISVAGLFCDYRKLAFVETTESGEHTKMTGKYKCKKSSNSESAETLSLEGIEDSYWTDRIIQCNPEDQVLFEPEFQNQEDFPIAKWEASPGLSPSLDNNQEVGNSEYSPTALILNFSDLESVPPIADLNSIFSQHGPLYESDTEVLDRSKRAKVIFKRRADAETAFSKSCKFSIFGPSLISYRLEYSPSPRKASRRTSKRRRN